ncbi:DUF982 domain-containing protein, partial [Rhizobium leguminosarum]|uniref:DUF982 domain-containing protein n=1 Tax=Rhizobium leguminosarum TaxID=384 RepID=UPI0035E43650
TPLPPRIQQPKTAGANSKLDKTWGQGHERHQRAVKTCRGVLNGSIPSIVAREAFVAACLEAGMPSVLAPWKRKPTTHPARPARLVAN